MQRLGLRLLVVILPSSYHLFTPLMVLPFLSQLLSNLFLSPSFELAVLLRSGKYPNGAGFSAHFLFPCSNSSASSAYIAPAECCHRSVFQVAVSKQINPLLSCSSFASAPALASPNQAPSTLPILPSTSFQSCRPFHYFELFLLSHFPVPLLRLKP
jgi:hypothetical protein